MKKYLIVNRPQFSGTVSDFYKINDEVLCLYDVRMSFAQSASLLSGMSIRNVFDGLLIENLDGIWFPVVSDVFCPYLPPPSIKKMAVALGVTSSEKDWSELATEILCHSSWVST